MRLIYNGTGRKSTQVGDFRIRRAKVGLCLAEADRTRERRQAGPAHTAAGVQGYGGAKREREKTMRRWDEAEKGKDGSGRRGEEMRQTARRWRGLEKEDGKRERDGAKVPVWALGEGEREGRRGSKAEVCATGTTVAGWAKGVLLQKSLWPPSSGRPRPPGRRCYS